jgi:hypothetical protein
MRINNAGRVGIGTTNPTSQLVINGGTGTSQTRFEVNTTEVQEVATNAAQNAYANRLSDAAQHMWKVGGSEAMRITSAGDVGIGTSSPNQTGFTAPVLSITNGTSGVLELIGTQASDGTVGQIAWYNTSGSTRTSQILGLRSGANNSGAITFQTSSAGTLAERMRINSLGNLGLGTTAPSSISANYTTLDIRGSAGGGMLMGITGSTHTYMYTDSGGSNMFTNDAIPLQFGTNNGERMRITSGGELLIGATSNATPTSSTSMAVLQSNFRNGGTYGMGMSFNSTGATGADHYYISFNTGTTTQRGYIYYNNGAGQVQLSATSDARLKENIVDAPSILPILDQVKVRQYDWKDTGNTNIGFVAQELYDVIPRAVAVGEDNENGSIKRVWGVDNGTLVPYLVKAIQELNAKITALENK